MTWQLTARTGAHRGTSWNISTVPLTLGRSLSCDITVGDPTVSRKHCEIVLEGDRVHFRDLGSRNVSLINGRVVVACHLDAGDEITLGAESFFVTRVTAPKPATEPPESESRYTTMSLGESFHLTEQAQRQFPADVHEMIRLYQFGLKLRKAHTDDEFAKLCLQELEESFPARVRTGVCCVQGQRITWYPPDFAPPPAVREHVLEVIDTRRAAIRSQREKRRLLKRLIVVGAAPLVHSGRCDGALVALSDARDFVLDETGLTRLNALAQAASPFLSSLAHRESFTPVNAAKETAGELEFLGHSPAVEKLRSTLARVGRTGLNTLIVGEPGTGKERAAHIIHKHSEVSSGPVISSNCVVIAGSGFLQALVGTELLTRNSNVESDPGLFDRASGGTLLLREVDALTPRNQDDLNALLERGLYTRVGGHEEVPIQFRLLSTTSQDLHAAVAEGKFREDLLRRLSAQRVDIKPLRRRPADIEALAMHFLRSGREEGMHRIKGITGEALDFLRELPLKGNALELRDTISRAARHSSSEYLNARDLVLAAPGDHHRVAESDPLENAERSLINAVLTQCNNSMPEAAAILGIPEEALSKLLAKSENP